MNTKTLGIPRKSFRKGEFHYVVTHPSCFAFIIFTLGYATSFFLNQYSILQNFPPIYQDFTSHKLSEAKDLISDAVNALRCFTTPGCYPRLSCESREKPMKIEVEHSYEEHSFCIHDLLSQQQHGRGESTLSAPRCLVYSFGINDSVDWETKMANLFGCEVFAFDPTSDFQKEVAPNVTFYKLGLQGSGTDVAATHSEAYDALDPSLLRTLGEIVRMLGHDGRKIDVLRMDCEGCEYGVLKQLACSGESHYVKQLMVEFHFQKNLGLSSYDDILIAADALKCLERERWGIVSLEASGCGLNDVEYVDPVLKIIKSLNFVAFATFRRAAFEEKMQWEVLSDAVQANAEATTLKNRYFQIHGTALPDGASEELTRKTAEVKSHLATYNGMKSDKSGGFDWGVHYSQDQ